MSGDFAAGTDGKGQCQKKMGGFVAALSHINIDILYEGLRRMPALGEEELAENCEILLGGGAVASLILLSRLGVDARLGTFLADGLFDAFSRRQLEKERIEYRNFYRGGGNPVAVTSIASFPADRSFLSFFPRKEDVSCGDRELYDLYHGAKICVGVEGHREVLETLRREGTTVVFDVGWRSDLCLDQLREILGTVDYFMPNEREALKMTGAKTPEQALEIISGYVPHTIVKLGPRGCIAKQGAGIAHFPACALFQPVDTTGAGDAFLAGVIYGLFQGWELSRCIRMGNVVGGFSTTAYGCLKAKLDRAAALRYLDESDA